MSHEIRYVVNHCSTSENQIMKQIKGFAYNPQESGKYHGNMKFHRDIICKNYDEAVEKIKELDNGWYDDHTVFFKDGRKKYWLSKVEWHT